TPRQFDHLDTATSSAAAICPPWTFESPRLAEPAVGEERRPISAASPRFVAGYQILEEVGRGGMSVGYPARQTHPARDVALRVLLAGAHAAAERRARFLAEADAFARLRHPNIVPIHEVGEHDGLPFLALEYVEGGSLADRLGGVPLPPREAAALVEQLPTPPTSAAHTSS